MSIEILLAANTPLVDDTVYEFVAPNHLFYISNIDSDYVSTAKNIILIGKNGPGPALGGTDADTSAVAAAAQGLYDFNILYDFLVIFQSDEDSPREGRQGSLILKTNAGDFNAEATFYCEMGDSIGWSGGSSTSVNPFNGYSGARFAIPASVSSVYIEYSSQNYVYAGEEEYFSPCNVNVYTVLMPRYESENWTQCDDITGLSSPVLWNENTKQEYPEDSGIFYYILGGGTIYNTPNLNMPE